MAGTLAQSVSPIHHPMQLMIPLNYGVSDEVNNLFHRPFG
jgi:hypothetical protein